MKETTYISYNQDTFENTIITDLNEVNLIDTQKINWVNFIGDKNQNTIDYIGEKFNLHELVLEELVEQDKRPKIQFYDSYIMFTVKSPVLTDDRVEFESTMFILGKNFLLTFNSGEGKYFDLIRKRLKENTGIIRSKTVDFLLYKLIDAVLDRFTLFLDKRQPQIEQLSKFNYQIDPSPRTLQLIEHLKIDTNQMKKNLLPIKDGTLKLGYEEVSFIKKSNLKFFHDIKSECSSIIGILDTDNQQLESASNLFFSIQGYRMNQIMKTLTIVSSIFIPLTFIAGIYGMNFELMPELKWKYGYFTTLAIMCICTGGMFLYFRNKKWM